MTLQEWMNEKGLNDAALAKKVNGALSRSQISRIRRAESMPSKDAAIALQNAIGKPIMWGVR
jgi:transcriptional regulator with XRE-family HTH domain